MFEQLRRKRMAIEQSVTGKANRDGMSSLERRKLVEKDLMNYNHLLNQTAQGFRKRPFTETSIPHHNKTAAEGLSWEKEEAGSVQDRQIVVSPSVKDISPLVHEPSALASEFYELSAEPNQNSHEHIFSPNKNLADFYQPPPLVPISAPPPQINISIPTPVSPKAEVNIHSLQQQSSRRESEPQIQDQEIKLPQMGNNSSRAQSNNNSEAIFFTSHFKEIMNNHDMQSPQKQPSPPPPILELAENRVESRGEQEQTGRFQAVGLQNNPSGQSLAISNDSSLKYSLNQSAIQDIITRKLSNQLVVDSLSPSNRRISTITSALILKEGIKDVVEFARMYAVAVGVQRNTAKGVFVELAVNREVRLQAKDKKIKAQSLIEQRQIALLQGCFNGWHMIAQAKQQGLINLVAARQRHTLQKCFKTFKMLLFDRRIHHQIDMYYLSKVFQAFRTATQKDSRRNNQKAFKLYFKNLKRRMFDAFLEGCYNSRREIAANEAAINHYEYSLFKKCFDAWRRLAPREEKYVRLAVTTTNLMKETADHRLLHTRTFDFYEIR